MNNITSVHRGIFTFVNIVLAIFAWILLPDIPFSVRNAIVILLLGTIIAVNIYPPLLAGRLLLPLLVSLYMLPLLIALAEWWLVLYLFGQRALVLMYGTQNLASIQPEPVDFGLVLLLGLSYGLCVALPLTARAGGPGADKDVTKISGIGTRGCVIQLVIGVILFVLSAISQADPYILDLIGKILSGVIGPVAGVAVSFLPASGRGFWIGLAVAALLGLLQNAQFGVLGLWMSGNLRWRANPDGNSQHSVRR